MIVSLPGSPQTKLTSKDEEMQVQYMYLYWTCEGEPSDYVHDHVSPTPVGHSQQHHPEHVREEIECLQINLNAVHDGW